jgi:hypothetical protein
MKESRKTHWEQVYLTKNPEEVSWTQAVPKTSLDFINSFNLPKNAGIIDIGGGDSPLVDFLLLSGFQNITVLDISAAALEKAKARLGTKSKLVKWVVTDIVNFRPVERYSVWHDRATFHFLTDEKQIAAYLRITEECVTQYMVMGTFSDEGPEKCSGMPVKRYTETLLQNQLNKAFIKVKCINEDHITPFKTKQSFLFCSFKRVEKI